MNGLEVVKISCWVVAGMNLVMLAGVGLCVVWVKFWPEPSWWTDPGDIHTVDKPVENP